ncbi:hypothetical protein MJO29_007216 [Puccinia striiformis f. sp. tritici]|uniref:hypothetical protein n=1 Tax=Puccinia striiformis f. sp. tritici TaxID=168172 RepID=UPI0020081E1C|nr:hypothetical protein Pst134EA_013386 [Puccinia striiformis f. sp. tritici]KAH9465506.1 hypothetical protein Pst134EA_013386 [Puccinia striiformis f. sp. tritici]KAI7955817.1 hypothetical protein MJO29_007216 [Puccinia striiformis f. sp. tritici]
MDNTGPAQISPSRRLSPVPAGQVPRAGGQLRWRPNNPPLFRPGSTGSNPVDNVLSSASSSSEDSDDIEYVRSTSYRAVPAHPNLSEYHLSRVIGKGSYGNVYLARRRYDQHPCAMKVMRKQDCAASVLSQTLKGEAQILASLNHPFVVKIEAAFQNNDHLFIGLQIATNGTFSEYLEAYAPMDTCKARFYICQLVAALDYLHDKEVVHGDLKPENMLVSESGYLKLADFGLARDISKEEPFDTCYGTVHYMAPEMITGRAFGPCVDWWALGVTMYQIVFARYPFSVEAASSEGRMERNDYKNLKKLIHAGNYDIPYPIEPQALCLLGTLLSHSAEHRNLTGQQMRDKHPYLQGIIWEMLLGKVYASPFAPPRPPLNPNDHQYEVDYAVGYIDREVRLRDQYGGFFHDFHFVGTPWQVSRDAHPSMLIPPSSNAEYEA